LEIDVRLWILSDLHLEFAALALPKVEADVVILAGDVDVKGNGLEWALETFPSTPVLYVFGNHEYYENAYPKHSYELKQKAESTNVRILENDTVTIDDVTFLGCSLWTDFNLYGNPKVAEREAEKHMPDFQTIRLSTHNTVLRASDTAKIHEGSLRWLTKELEHRTTKKVVITHHAPSEKSVSPRFIGSPLNPAFASNLEQVVESSNAALWIHGHMHSASDYGIGKTRVLCNPRGYPNERGTNFIPDLVVDV
jgi:Icc-related predicted phosphoesterase